MSELNRLSPPLGGEVRVTDPKTGGQKGAKPERFDLIPPAFLCISVMGFVSTNDDASHSVMAAIHNLSMFAEKREPGSLTVGFAEVAEAMKVEGKVDPGEELARVNEMGSRKYAAYNWMRGYAWSLSFAALCRHVKQWRKGEICDAESGLHHLAHALWHFATLHTFATRGLGTDDLFPIAKPVAP